MVEEGGEMLFVISVVEGTREAREREVHGKFVDVEFVAVKVIAEVFEVVVEKMKLFTWGSLPGEKSRGEGGR